MFLLAAAWLFSEEASLASPATFAKFLSFRERREGTVQRVTVSTSIGKRVGSSVSLSPHPFVAQPDRSVRVGLAFCQPEIALRELAREAGDAIA